MEVANLSGPDLVKLYNEHAARRNLPPVKRFADRKTALRRTLALLETEPLPPPPPAPPKNLKLESPKGRPGFNFPFKGPVRAMREGTLRALIAEKMRGGASLADLEDVVSKFDKGRGKEPHNIHERVYGAIRLLHFYCKYGIRQDLSTGTLHLVQA